MFDGYVARIAAGGGPPMFTRSPPRCGVTSMAAIAGAIIRAGVTTTAGMETVAVLAGIGAAGGMTRMKTSGELPSQHRAPNLMVA